MTAGFGLPHTLPQPAVTPGFYESDDQFNVAVLIFAPEGDECFSSTTQLVMPRHFVEAARLQ